ncbi:hypothetical protein BCR37DRAFT_379945 [Protomyces lactucae-debilis]|uniref:Rab-GAP TBC domain-containing protein n=1 Tax=Protomyces lactucae-debilis TaxID=2754530 RepID=A0A1Y2FEJ0_PROLT|nr:uncharacterized protein BCR37DRAFT_379945 [Protomyces lactucae-debilis]ORY82027.1 hypothetical protein BCR37DRAFT_379945 [Protomyces lactucae-debilis]
MHELAGVLLCVVEQAGGPNVLANTYALFDAVMRYAASFYEVPSKGESPVCVRANHIQHTLLVQFDPSLAEKLSHLEVEPQMYTLKWLRLLFLREFTFNEVLVLWDLLFAADRTLKLMDFIACAMLIRIHDRLMLPETDYSAALTLLMRYPHPGTVPALFVQDALALRAGESGQNLMERYQGSSTASQRQVLAKPPLVETSTNLAGVAGYSLGALLHQTDRLGLNNYFKGTLTELSRGVTEARQVLSRQSTGTSGSPSTPSGSHVNRELAGHLALVISNLRCGEPLEENLQRLEDLKYVLQGRKSLAELKQVKVPERQRPATAPQAEAIPTSSIEKATVRGKQPAVPAGATKRVSLQSDFGFLL